MTNEDLAIAHTLNIGRFFAKHAPKFELYLKDITMSMTRQEEYLKDILEKLNRLRYDSLKDKLHEKEYSTFFALYDEYDVDSDGYLKNLTGGG